MSGNDKLLPDLPGLPTDYAIVRVGKRYSRLPTLPGFGMAYCVSTASLWMINWPFGLSTFQF